MSHQSTNKTYDSIYTTFIERGLSLAAFQTDPLYFNQGEPISGEAFSLVIMPFEQCGMGSHVHDLFCRVHRDISAIVPKDAILWADKSDLHCSVYFAKKSFADDPSAEYKNEQIRNMLIKACRDVPSFCITFDRLLISNDGTIMIAGYSEAIEQLRQQLHRTFQNVWPSPLPPKIFNCTFGRIRHDLEKSAIELLRHYCTNNTTFEELVLRVWTLCYACSVGNIYNFSIKTLFNVPLKGLFNDQWQRMHDRRYGVMSVGKWLAHEDRVETILNASYYNVLPVNAQIATSALCQYNCPTCSYGVSKDEIRDVLASGEAQKESFLMSESDLRSTLESLRITGVKSVTFTGGGEPLVNPNTVEGIEYAIKLGFNVGLFTTGCLITEEFAERVARCDMQFIRVSFNAGTPEAYAIAHGTEAYYFHKAIECIRQLAEKKQQYKAGFNLGIGVIITPISIDTLIDIGKIVLTLAEQYPGMINNISFRPAIRYLRGTQNTAYTQRSIEYVKNSLSLARYADEYESFIKKGTQFSHVLFENASSTIDSVVKPMLESGPYPVNVLVPTARAEHMRGNVRHHRHPFKECLACPWVVFVGPDTEVYHCVELALDPRTAYGKLRERSLKEIWSSDRRKKVIRWLNENMTWYCPPVCMLYEYNEIFGRIGNAQKNGFANEITTEVQAEMKYYRKTIGCSLGNAGNFL